MKLQLTRLPICLLTLLVLISLNLTPFVTAQEIKRQELTSTDTPNEAVLKKEALPETSASYPYRPISSWIGQRFVFLPAPKMLENGTYDDFNGALKRKDYAGRKLKVVNLSDFSGRVHVEFELEDNGVHVRARTLPNKESLKGLLLLEDLEKARTQWVGQTLWCKQMLLSTYDEASDLLGSVPIKRYAPLKVLQIEPGWDEEKPLRFILQNADGKRGFLDVNISGTNIQRELRHLNRFDDQFLTTNPRLTYKWPANIWTAIENNRVVSGMTTEQVVMSWGIPERTARTTAGEQWTYSAGVLIFNNGVLVSIQ